MNETPKKIASWMLTLLLGLLSGIIVGSVYGFFVGMVWQVLHAA